MANLEDDRWSNWFENSTYKHLLENITKYIDEITQEYYSTDYHTPHDSSHCLAVEKIVKALIKKSKIELTELDKFILFTSVWTHDIGMIEKVAINYLGDDYSTEKKRDIHEKISARFITVDERFKKIFSDEDVSENLTVNYVNTINTISKFHRRKYDIDESPKFRFIEGDKVNVKLLACLVRLGDTLHVDSSRYDRKLYDILQIGSFDRASRLHWLKSYVVSGIYLDIDDQTIIITIDLPESEDARSELEENARRLEFIIHEDIYEDILTVSDTFREYNLRFYAFVKLNINYCPGIDEEKKEDIIGVLNDIDIVLSPNTSKVIKKSIDSIVSLTKMGFKNYEYFYNQTDQLIKHLQKIYYARPCHVGLSKITEMMEDEFNDFPDKESKQSNAKINELQRALSEKALRITEQRKRSEKIINARASEALKDIKNIFLFGYSEMVSNFLSSAMTPNFKELVNIFIFEGSGKRRLSITNNIEYNDGIHYATNLSKMNFKNIFILPDICFATLINDPKIGINKDNSLLLFGANGIDESDYGCGHTSGHLMMSIIAKHYDIPLKVVADKYKLGRVNWDPTLKREGTYWLTGQKNLINELKRKNIKTLNYREDKVPGDFIKEIIMDN